VGWERRLSVSRGLTKVGYFRMAVYNRPIL
jgi:hypothetical protein